MMKWYVFKEKLLTFLIWFFLFPFVVWAWFLYLINEDFSLDKDVIEDVE